MTSFRCIILGAAGRDFHDFRQFFAQRPEFRVCCFTAQQIPFIDARAFPKELAGPHYEEDIPTFPERELPDLIRRFDVDFVFLAYSDLSHEEVMHKASLVQSAGASFALLGPRHTQLESKCPVVAVTAVRTGAGKSSISQAIAAHFASIGKRVGVIRHPMPYGDLRQQVVQRFATMEDLDHHACTVEEREEYQPYVERGLTIYAGVDYEKVLRAAEEGSDVILWDGGNNDGSFVRPDLSVVVLDPLRAGHELQYYPGETNFRSADVLIINKVEAASAEQLQQVRRNIARINPGAQVIEADLHWSVERPDLIRGARVLVVEDGPTVTHGGMAFGAGTLAARANEAAEIIDPRPFAVGSVARAFSDYPHIEHVLPALGYSPEQRGELRATIVAAAPDVVVDGSPARIGGLLELDVPVVRVSYVFEQRGGPSLLGIVERSLDAAALRE